MGIIMIVKCLGCLIEKEFNKYEINRGRHENWRCKSCAIKNHWSIKGIRTEKDKLEYQRKYYQQNRAKLDKYNTEWLANKRLELIGYFGGKCVVCHESDPIVLDFDHIFDDGAEERRLTKGKNVVRHLSKKSTDKSRYQLLCKNCNWRKEYTRRQNAKC